MNRKLFFFCLANVLLGVLLAGATRYLVQTARIPSYASASGAGATRELLRGSQFTDSWAPMFEALRVHQAGLPIYDTVFYARKVKFQYPLTSLEPLEGLRMLGIDEKEFLAASRWVSWLAVLATLGASLAIFRNSTGQERSRYTWIASMALIISGICFYPITRAYVLGQIQVFLTMLFALALYLWIRGKQAYAGALIGLMVVIKPQYALIGLWFALRKKFSALIASMSVAAVSFAVAVAWFGWREQLRYLDILSFITRHGESFYPNLSVNGVLNRLLFNGPNLIWDAHAYAPYQPWIYGVTVVTSALILAFALLFPRGNLRGGTADFCAIVVAATAASPVAWEHHYGVLFPIFAWLATVARRPREWSWIAVAYLLVANAWTPANALAGVPLLNLLQSVALLGVFGLLLLLVRMLEPVGPIQAVRLEVAPVSHGT